VLYRLVQRVLGILLPWYFDWTVEGTERLPESGAAIVVANHVNYLDPLAMGLALRRPLHFMAKRELFNNPVIGWLLRKVYAFPVRRGAADRQAIRHALKILKEGEVLALFPEGTRSATGNLQELQRGAAMLALRSGAPVIPMVILGGYEALAGGRKIPRRGPLTVRIGKPLIFDFDGSNSETITLASSQIRDAIAALYPDGPGGGQGRIFTSNKSFTGRKGYPSERKKI